MTFAPHYEAFAACSDDHWIPEQRNGQDRPLHPAFSCLSRLFHYLYSIGLFAKRQFDIQLT